MESITYNQISEVADQIKKFGPPMVFKYRNWKDDSHKRMLANQEAWFSHPHNLNDPLDCRPPFTYNSAEVFTQEFFEKLLKYGAEDNPDWNEEKLMEESIAKWEQIKYDPVAHFDENRKLTETYERLEPIGVFSVGTDGMNEGLWKLYGDDFKGYNIGFTTVDLCEEMNCTVSLVDYNDDPYLYTFSDEDRLKMYLFKTTKWAYEDEFRFITFGIGVTGQRLRKFRTTTVAEITIGHNMPEADKQQILALIEQIYPAGTPVYETRITATGLDRTKIK